MSDLYIKPTHFVQVVENAINMAYRTNLERWNRLMDFYESRYLNPDAPEKNNWKLPGYNPIVRGQ